ncbi:E3 ubiquitin-protein ligase RNF26 [Calliphora vicina]|uniref:E3 ubiquitin-protein ligase RNF26 n=1 Tax=Calliphora vicina TaxID=7373 RepID=UPI00325ACDB8
MLSFLVQPVLKCMHFLHAVAVFILTASYHMGRGIFLLIIQVCNIIRDILTALAIIGEELYRFVCELNTSIAAVSNYIRSSANGGINCVLEAVGVFIKHISKFFINTRLHTKLLATQIGSFIADFLNLLRNALLLIADCAWWLITLLPRWLLYALIAVGDFIVESITAVRKALVYTVQVIVEDVFRLTIGIVLLFILWHNRRRVGLAILRLLLKVKRFIRLCWLCLKLLIRRMFRRRVIQTLTTPTRTLGAQRRSPLPRPSISPSNSDKSLDSTQRCVVCRDRQKCVLLLPCKHLCLCEECADYMFFTSQRQNCPLCRTFIDHSMSVYI